LARPEAVANASRPSLATHAEKDPEEARKRFFEMKEKLDPHGHFNARRSQIVAFRTSDARPWEQQWSTSLAGSFLRHELVHMAVWQIGAREGTFFRPEWHEFIAYAIQLDLMDPDLREVILATHPRLKPFDDLLQINEFTSRMDPELFALAAYSTYRDRGGERFVRELLRAEIVPPEFIYPFPTLPGQTPAEP
jgi:hypothetical protein